VQRGPFRAASRTGLKAPRYIKMENAPEQKATAEPAEPAEFFEKELCIPGALRGVCYSLFPIPYSLLIPNP